MSYKSDPQECPTRVSYKSVIWTYVAFGTCLHSGSIPCACHVSFRVHTSKAHKVLRLSRNVTSVTPRNLTSPCARRESFHIHTSNAHKVVRLSRNVTSVTPRNLTIPCARRESFHIHTSHAHKVLRLSRNVTSVTPRNLTIPCAGHEMSPPSRIATSRFPAPATKIPLPHLKTRTKSCACQEKQQCHLM